MKLEPKIARALRRFEHAARERSWRGNRDPDDVPEIDREYSQAKHCLERLLLDQQARLEKALAAVQGAL